MKLIMQTISAGTKCKLCENIGKKMGKRAVEVNRIARWRGKGPKHGVSIDKSMEIIRALDYEVYELGCERQRRLMDTHGGFTSRTMTTAQSNVQHLEGSSHAGGEGDKTQHQEPRFEFVRRLNSVCGLPITFEGHCGPASVMAVPDSGSAFNVISLDLAMSLGLRIEWENRDKTELRLLDGTTAISTAAVKAQCRFARTFYTEPRKIQCTFFVLPSLVSNLIMSAQFLEDTETFTKFRNRLVKLTLQPFSLLKLRSIGRLRQRLRCCVDGEHVEAIPDTGSDIDVVSLEYATKRKFKMQSTEELIEFADGTVKKVCGKVSAQLSLGMHARIIPVELSDDSERPSEAVIEEAPGPTEELQDRPVRHVVQTTFYVLDGIAVDVLIGAHSIESLNLYTEHTDALTSRADADLQDDMVLRIGLLSKFRNRPNHDSSGLSQNVSDGMHETDIVECLMLIPASFIFKIPRATRRSRPT